ncbi:MAG TPA: hypothetical protein VFW66_06625 [Gemmatimonadales bacterium]|nr:hypothetical protein [Gemmatimonadales bacterium]
MSPRLRAAIRAAAVAVALTGCASLPPAPAPTNPIRFLAINDVDTVDTLHDGSGGLARVATMRARIASEGPTLFVLAGGALHGGRDMVAALNAAKLDYATLGEPGALDLPRDTLIARIAESRFKWLSANCTEADGTPFPGVLAWDTVRLAERKIGLFGITAAGDYPAPAHCGDPAAAAHRVLDTLRAQGADLIVALTHQPVAADRALLNREPALDLVLGGDTDAAADELVAGRHALKADPDARTAQFATVWGTRGQWQQAVALLPVHAGIPPDTSVTRVVAAAGGAGSR